MNRKTLFFLISGGLIFLYLLFTLFLFLPRSSQKSSQGENPEVTSMPGSEESEIQPTTTADKLLQTIENRKVLPEHDAIKRAALVARLEGDSGILNETDTYVLSYLKTPDVFQAEIRSDDIDSVKVEVASWLATQGLSQSAICNLPLMYFPSSSLLQTLKAQKKTFSPLPLGC